MSEVRRGLPEYVISKMKVSLQSGVLPDQIIAKLQVKYAETEQNTDDGLKLLFKNEWVHIRKSNTEPIIRIYAESTTKLLADNLAAKFVKEIEQLCVASIS